MQIEFIYQLIVGLLTIGGAFAVARWRIGNAEKLLDAQANHIDRLEEAFQRHRLEVAEKYVSATNFSKFEAEIKGAIDRLSSRIDLALASKVRTRG